MEPIIIGIGFLVMLIIAYFHREKTIESQIEQKMKFNQLQNDQFTEKQVNRVKFEYNEKNQQKQDHIIAELKQKKRELEKELLDVKGAMIHHRTDYLVNQETTRSKFDYVDENLNRLFLKQRKTGTKMNQHKIEFQSAEKQNAERFYSHDAQLQLTQATTKMAIEFQGKNIDMLQGGLQTTNQKMDQHRVDLFNSQMQNEQRFHQQETNHRVQQAESRTAFKYIDQGIQQLHGNVQSTNQRVDRQQNEFHQAQLQNEQHFHQQATQLQVQQAESRTAFKYIDQGINRLQTDVHSTNQRVNQQQIEFQQAREQIANQFNRVGNEIENTKQASRAAIENLNSQVTNLHKSHQEQKSGTNSLLNFIGTINPLLNVGVQAFKAISDTSSSNNNNTSSYSPIVLDLTSKPMEKFEYQVFEEVIEPVLSLPAPKN